MESGYVYICYYCNEKFDLFKDIFNHLIEKHNAETFKIKKLKFGKKEGVLGYTGTTVNYKFKPLDDILAGKNVILCLSYTVSTIQNFIASINQPTSFFRKRARKG
jgi:hypothetical protein